jgi:streptomycin 6-kinase
MHSISIPESFQNTIRSTYGEKGDEWLGKLPELIKESERRWDLRLEKPFSLTYNFVAPVQHADGRRLVIKMGVPNPELISEAHALHIFAGRGAVQLLASDLDLGILLLERLQPGLPLEKIEDDEAATIIASQVMRRLWRPVSGDHELIFLEKWVAGLQRLRVEFSGGSGPFPEGLVRRAELQSSELLASTRSTVLLHGDLHHWNILSAGREPWLAIDPKGIIGDPAFEVGAWLLNPKPEKLSRNDLKRQLVRRIDQFTDDLELDRQRVIGWGFVLAVLSAWWGYEEHGYGWDRALAIAKLLTEL